MALPPPYGDVFFKVEDSVAAFLASTNLPIRTQVSDTEIEGSHVLVAADSDEELIHGTSTWAINLNVSVMTKIQDGAAEHRRRVALVEDCILSSAAEIRKGNYDRLAAALTNTEIYVTGVIPLAASASVESEQAVWVFTRAYQIIAQWINPA